MRPLQPLTSASKSEDRPKEALFSTTRKSSRLFLVYIPLFVAPCLCLHDMTTIATALFRPRPLFSRPRQPAHSAPVQARVRLIEASTPAFLGLNAQATPSPCALCLSACSNRTALFPAIDDRLRLSGWPDLCRLAWTTEKLSGRFARFASSRSSNYLEQHAFIKAPPSRTNPGLPSLARFCHALCLPLALLLSSCTSDGPRLPIAAAKWLRYGEFTQLPGESHICSNLIPSTRFPSLDPRRLGSSPFR